VKIGGSVIGHTDADRGSMIASSIKNVTVGGNVDGDDSNDSGSILAVDCLIGSVTVRDFLRGGEGTHAGVIMCAIVESSAGKIAKIVIGHGIRGADISSESPLYAGSIAGGNIDSITLGGSLIAALTTLRARRRSTVPSS